MAHDTHDIKNVKDSATCEIVFLLGMHHSRKGKLYCDLLVQHVSVLYALGYPLC